MEHRDDIIRLRDQERLTERQIATRLALSPSTVHYWLQREMDPKTGKRGRPRKTDAALDASLKRASVEDPFKTAVDLRVDLKLNVSVDTVRRRLKEQGLRSRIPAPKPFLKPHHIQGRLEFVVNYLHWTLDDWNRIMFSDEKLFRAKTRGRVRVYRPLGNHRFDAQYLVPSDNPKGTHTVNVWSGFGNGIYMIRNIDAPTFTSPYYIDHILPDIHQAMPDDYVYQHDRASIHFSKASKHWFEANNVDYFEDWPSKAPDLNPVENVWAEIVRTIRPMSEDVEELWENVEEAFVNLGEEYFQKLIQSMPRRISTVLANRGGWGKY